MNIFPIQGLTEDRCAYGRTQGVLLPVWNTKECPVSVFHINADDMILSMLMIWFFSKNHIMKAKESVWQKISDLNYPFAISHVPFPKQAVSPLFSPYKDRCKQDHGSPCDPWDLTSAHLISLISIRITVEVKLSPILGGASHFRFPENGILSHPVFCVCVVGGCCFKSREWYWNLKRGTIGWGSACVCLHCVRLSVVIPT